MIIVRHDRRFAFLSIFALVNLIPYIGFADFFELRYLYTSIFVSAILLGIVIDWVWVRLNQPQWSIVTTSGAIALLVIVNTFGVAAGVAEWGKSRGNAPCRSATLCARIPH